MRQWRIAFYAAALNRIDPLELAWQLSYHNLEVVAKSAFALFVRTDDVLALQQFTWNINVSAGALVFASVETYLDGEWVSLDNYLQEVA